MFLKLTGHRLFQYKTTEKDDGTILINLDRILSITPVMNIVPSDELGKPYEYKTTGSIIEMIDDEFTYNGGKGKIVFVVKETPDEISSAFNSLRQIIS